MIEMIEFVLGAVTNTASCLRLWALSLEHSQLTDVIYEKVFLAAVDKAADPDTGLAAADFYWFVGFAVWLFCTVAVLRIMESLSAVLHALRLVPEQVLLRRRRQVRAVRAQVNACSNLMTPRTRAGRDVRA